MQTVGSAKLPGGQDVYSYKPSTNPAPEQTEALQGIGAASYTSDLSTGNLTGWTRGGVQVALTYDAANRLTGVQSAGAAHPLLQAQETLQYDSFGQLAVRQFPAGSDAYNAGEERRVYLGDDITIVKHTDGTLDAVFHAPFDVDFWGSATAVNSQRSGATYLHRDRLGSVIGISKQGAASTSVQWRYTPYGAVDGELDTNTTSCSANRIRPIDARTERGFADTVKLSQGLLLMGARVYDPTSRRFVQADNVDLKRYTYADGDPINELDPSGHDGVATCRAGETCPVTTDPKPGDRLTDPAPPPPLIDEIAAALREYNKNNPRPDVGSEWAQSGDTGGGFSASDGPTGGGGRSGAAALTGGGAGSGPIGAPGFAGSFIPVYGSGRTAINDFQTGHPVWGTVDALVAVSDLLLVGTAAKTVWKVGMKGLFKFGGSHTWDATRKWLARSGWREFRGQPFHHWFIEQRSAIGKLVPNVVKNQPWNLMPLRSVLEHEMIHGGHGASGLYGLWYGTPDWAKLAAVSTGGRVADAFSTASEESE